MKQRCIIEWLQIELKLMCLCLVRKRVERISIGVCCNASGNDKLKLLLISKVKRPRCFGKVFDPNNIVHYYNNEKAWMTTIIFEDWLKKWNAKLELQKRCILL